MVLNGNYSNFISLGHFCSVAMELERCGLRSASFPYDWLITDFPGVIESINTHFENFFEITLYEQSKKRLYVYRNKKFNFEFVHDFSKYISLQNQFKGFEEKYNRRILRFYNEIKNSTLFVRYIKDQMELEWIEKNIDYVRSTFKKFNENNEILFVANTGLTSSRIEMYNVEPDKNDTVARRFIEKECLLEKFFQKCEILNKERNIKRYNKKNSFVKKTLRGWRKNMCLFLRKIFFRAYVCERQYD